MSRSNKQNPIMVSPGALLVASIALFVPWATYTQLAPWTTPVTILVLPLGLLLASSVVRTPRKDGDATIILFLLYMVLLLFSRAWTIVTQTWFDAVFWWVVCFISFAGAIRFVLTPKHIRLLVYFSVVGALIAGANLQVVSDEWGNDLARRMVHGHNMNYTSYALSGVVVLSLVSSSFIHFPRLFRLALPFIIVAILYFQVELGTRGALIASVAVIMLHLIRGIASPLIMRSIPVIALSFTLLVSFGFLALPIDAIFARGMGDLSRRDVIWAEAIDYIVRYPLFGIGPNSFAGVSTIGSGAHNFVLIIALETGILGVALFFFFFWNVFRLFLTFKNKRAGSYLVGAFSAYWFPLMSSGHWETSPLSWIVVASFLRIAYLYRGRE